jgi:hypothetical protein
MILTDDIQIIDDFVSIEQADILELELLGAWFPWYLNNGIDFDNDGRFQFVHNFFKNYEWVSANALNLLLPITQKLNMLSIIHIKANLSLKEENIKPIFHKDVISETSKTAIYYVNDNNGKTLFENGVNIDCKKNRVVIFPSKLSHTGILHSDNTYGGKCVINFNYFKNEIL